eukprot:s50_g23.t1
MVRPTSHPIEAKLSALLTNSHHLRVIPSFTLFETEWSYSPSRLRSWNAREPLRYQTKPSQLIHLIIEEGSKFLICIFYLLIVPLQMPLPRKRCSSTAAVGGAKNTKEQVFDNEDFLTDSAPWTSMSSRHTLPFFVTSCTAAIEVP